MKQTINQALLKGVDAQKAGKLNEAEKIYQAILLVNPNNNAALSNLGVLLYTVGRLDEAKMCYIKLISQNLNNADAHCNLGVILQELNELENSESSLKKAIKLKPDYEMAYNNLGNTLKRLGKLNDAVASYRKAIKLRSNYIDAHYNLSVILQELDQLKDSEIICKKAIELKSDHHQAYNNLGIILQKLGSIEEAEKAYQKAIDFKYDYVEAHLNLSRIKTFDKKDGQFILMQKLYISKSLTDEQLCHINFSLGKANEDLKNFEGSFKHYSEGNKLRNKSLNYNITQDIEIFEDLKKTYPIIKKNSLKDFKFAEELTPVFILGMPRSGTTLVEQIITSHSSVIGAGELTYIEQFGDKIARGKIKTSSEILINFRNTYLKKLKELYKTSSMVTDKLPLNFRYIGLICSTFPEAKIIHIKRNSSATCWGNYSQLFSNKKSFHYCYNLDNIIAYYSLYQNIMNFWDKHLSDRIYNLNYDELTVNQEEETKKLINYLGLDWQEECLYPENNKRSVSTASSKQIRQKIYQGSSRKWKKFELFLKGKFNNLND